MSPFHHVSGQDIMQYLMRLYGAVDLGCVKIHTTYDKHISLLAWSYAWIPSLVLQINDLWQASDNMRII